VFAATGQFPPGKQQYGDERPEEYVADDEGSYRRHVVRLSGYII
jgi:hypothetical protein